MDPLRKFQTPPVFPKLGVHAVQSPTPIVDTRFQLRTKVMGGFSAIKPTLGNISQGEFARERNQHVAKPALGARYNTADVAPHVHSGYVLSNELRNKTRPTPRPDSETTDLATQQHENFHDVMGQVEALHGQQAREHLVHNIVHDTSKQPEFGDAMKWFANDYVASITPRDHPHFNEEVIAKLHNYLNDPSERAMIASHVLGLKHHSTSPNPPMPRAYDSRLKQAWKHIQHLSASADQSWLTPSPGVRAEEERLRNDSDFQNGFVKSEADTAEVALVLVVDGCGRILLGKRNDTGKWTMPGGHLEPGEDPVVGASRELYEETCLKPTSMTLLKVQEPHQPGAPRLHCFTAAVAGEPSSHNDPDQEVEKWEWVDCRGGLPANVYDNLHGPEGMLNVIRQVYDLEKSDRVWLDAGFADLSKNDMAKSEVQDLLHHPHPGERALALKLDTATPHDVAQAILDPDPEVFFAAFRHPQAHHALNILASNTRDASGVPIFDRHDVLLKDPRCTPEHVISMQDAVKADGHLPLAHQADRLHLLGSRPLSKAEPILAGTSGHWGHKRIAEFSHPGKLADASLETTMPHLGHLEEAYNHHVLKAAPVEPQDADLHGPGTCSPKVLYRVPVAGESGTQRLMVKPYHESGAPLSGWAESTSQHLYHAAGIGDLHQKSFVAPHGVGDTMVPASVIHIEDADPSDKVSTVLAHRQNPELAEQARRIAVMDYLSNNNDRHSGNLMVRPDSTPMAIDHAEAFHYGHRGNNFSPYANSAPGILSPFQHTMPESSADHSQGYGPTMKWWGTVSPQVKDRWNERLQLVKDPTIREEMSKGFQKRAKFLDYLSKLPKLPFDWHKAGSLSYTER